MNSTIDYDADVIDSTDIINRIAALRKIKEDGQLTGSDEAELADLKRVESECQDYGNWEYGELLIKEEHFTTHISEIIEECYDMKKILSGDWPYRHMTINWEAAADEARYDYIEVEINGNTYLIHC